MLRVSLEISIYPIRNGQDPYNWQLMLVRMGISKTLVYCWWTCKFVQSLLKSLWWSLRHLTIDLLYPAVPLVRDIRKGLYSLLQIFLLIHLHYCSVRKRQIWKHLTYLSRDESMLKMWYIKQEKIPQFLKKWNS